MTDGLENASSDTRHDATLVTVRLLVLGLLAIAALWPEVRQSVRMMLEDGDWVHGLIAPLAILLLVYGRRRALSDALTSGSVWGIVLLIGGLAFCAVNIWPLQYGLLRRLALVPIWAGLVLASCGWRVLWLSVPMLLLLGLSIPVGPRLQAALIIRPETHALTAVHKVLDALPGVEVARTGPDLDFTTPDKTGTVALGQPRRGASLIPAYLTIGVFIAGVRVRPFWQLVVIALVAAPVALLCSVARLIGWGLLEIYGDPDPLRAGPRILTAAFSLLLAYASFGVICRLLSAFEANEEESDERGARASDTPT